MSRIPSIIEIKDKVICKEVCRETPDISVVTVCYNPIKAGRIDLFRKSLDSVQQQEEVQVEHIIIDGASTDGTVQWLKEYKNTTYNISILSMPDEGIYDAMNRGIALSHGKYLLFLGTDDYFHNPHGLKRSLDRIEQFSCEFSFAPVCFSDPLIRHNPQLAPQKRIHRFLISWCFSHQSMLTKRSALIAIDGFDTFYRSAADYDLLLRLIENGAKGCFVPCCFSTFNTEGFSKENQELSITEFTHILQNFYSRYYSTEMTYDEVSYIVKYRIYPHKYLSLYKDSQRLIRERFVGIPYNFMTWLSRWFNYTKYYLKCINNSRKLQH